MSSPPVAATSTGDFRRVPMRPDETVTQLLGYAQNSQIGGAKTKGLRTIIREYGMEKLDDDNTRRRLVAFEAYDVLSDPYWRGVYDRFGEIAIKKGIFVDNGPGVKRYAYHGDIFLTYKSIYGSTNPFAHIISMLSQSKATVNNAKKRNAKRIPIGLTLNEVFFGALKKINVSDKSDGPQCSIVNVKIPKGLPTNSEIGHEFPDGRTVVFITNDLPHERFVRSGNDLIITYNVTWRHMILGVQYAIKTLDNKLLRVNITQMITPKYQKIIRGEGMPVYGTDRDERGDLVLRFEIKMPRHLSVETAKLICETLPETNVD